MEAEIRGNTLVNQAHGETVYALLSGAECGIREDHRHCTTETCPMGKHDGGSHCVIYEQPSREAALRVVKNEIRRFTFGASSIVPSVGEVEHVEAKGLIAIEDVPVKKDAAICARSTHRHVRNDSANPNLEGDARLWNIALPPDEEMCVIPEFYPLTLHLDLPIGDSLGGVALGDKIIVSLRRTETRIEGGLITGMPAYEMPVRQPERLTTAVAGESRG